MAAVMGSSFNYINFAADEERAIKEWARKIDTELNQRSYSTEQKKTLYSLSRLLLIPCTPTHNSFLELIQDKTREIYQGVQAWKLVNQPDVVRKEAEEAIILTRAVVPSGPFVSLEDSWRFERMEESWDRRILNMGLRRDPLTIQGSIASADLQASGDGHAADRRAAAELGQQQLVKTAISSVLRALGRR